MNSWKPNPADITPIDPTIDTSIVVHMVMVPIRFEVHESIGSPIVGPIGFTVTRVSNYELPIDFTVIGAGNYELPMEPYRNGTLWL